MIEYTSDPTEIAPDQLEGFFEGWPSPPSPETRLRVLRHSFAVVLALDRETNTVAGFVNAISDGALAAFIPLLEVRSEYRGRGIGTELVRRMLDRLSGLYSVDLVCDETVVPFYERLGLIRGCAMMRRNRGAIG